MRVSRITCNCPNTPPPSSYQLHYTVRLPMNKDRSTGVTTGQKCVISVMTVDSVLLEYVSSSSNSSSSSWNCQTLAAEQFLPRANSTDRRPPIAVQTTAAWSCTLLFLSWHDDVLGQFSTARLGLCAPPFPHGAEPVFKEKHGAWDRVPELTTASPYADSRVDFNSFTQPYARVDLIPIPELTLSPSQGL
jgi:hypothetical protein